MVDRITRTTREAGDLEPKPIQPSASNHSIDPSIDRSIDASCPSTIDASFQSIDVQPNSQGVPTLKVSEALVDPSHIIACAPAHTTTGGHLDAGSEHKSTRARKGP